MNHADFKVYYNNQIIDARCDNENIKLVIPYSCDCGYIEIAYHFDVADEYVLFPACAYNGNKFDVSKKFYPPMFETEEARVDMPNTITDVVRLNKDGSGKIEVTTGDVSVPMVGVYSQNKGTLLYTVQEINGYNLGLSYEKGKIGITYPHIRKEKMYRWACGDEWMVPSTDKGICFTQGQEIIIPYKLFVFGCEGIAEFYKVFFQNRKCMGLDDQNPVNIPIKEQLKIQIDKYNKLNYREKFGFYGSGAGNEDGVFWQTGWCGDGMIPFVLMKFGGQKEWERSIKTLDFMFDMQAESGFFNSLFSYDSSISGDGFGTKGTEKWHLIRRSADALYFIFKHFALFEEKKQPIPARYIDGAKKLSDAMVTLWEAYGQLGQFVNVDTGEIIVGGSTSGAIVPAALVSAYRFFGEEAYLEIAEKSAQKYYDDFVSKGYTTGGPGEILQCPDSESAFALFESYVELYDLTRNDKWLSYAEQTLWYASSWVVSYNYRFPNGSEFNRLGIKTVGTVFANVQNKHSAPGLCTLSGNSIYKLYQFTGNKLYSELIKDIALAIPQCISTKERPIYSWDVEPKKLPQGFCCERVNMSDWEDYDKVGGVFCGSCWPEATNLLTIAEVAADLGME